MNVSTNDFVLFAQLYGIRYLFYPIAYRKVQVYFHCFKPRVTDQPPAELYIARLFQDPYREGMAERMVPNLPPQNLQRVAVRDVEDLPPA